MPGELIRMAGPAGAGKSAAGRRLLDDGAADVVIDMTSVWAALRMLERGPDGRYPARLDSDPALGLTAWAKTAIAREALRRDLRAVKTSSTPADYERDAELARAEGAGFREVVVDPGRAVVEARLADPETGVLSAECEEAVNRWFGSRAPGPEEVEFTP